MSVFGALIILIALKERSLFHWNQLPHLYRRSSVLWVIATLLSLMFATFFPIYDYHISFIQYFVSIKKNWYLLIPAAMGVIWSQTSNTQKIRAFQVYMTAFAIGATLTISQFLFNIPLSRPIPGAAGLYHGQLFFGHHLSLSNIFLFPTFLALAISFDHDSTPKTRRLASVAFLLGSIAIFTSFSRIAWVALPAGIILFGLLEKKWRHLLAAIAITTPLLALIFQLPVIYERLRSDLGHGDRYKLWESALDLFQIRPIFGVGFRQFEQIVGRHFESISLTNASFTGHAHNLYLDVLANTGLFGIIAFLLLLYSMIQGSLLRGTHTSFRSAQLACWFSFLISGLTQVNYFEGKVSHTLFLYLGVAMAWNKHPLRHPHNTNKTT